MRKILFFSVFILFSVVMKAQTWTQQITNMSGTSIGVDQVSVVDSNIVWVNGFNGSGTTARAKVCSHTQDGGTTWVAGTYTGFGATVFAQVLSAVNYSKAFAIAMDTVSSVASFWKTTDGGLNWSLVTGVMNTGTTTFADGVMFWNASKGFCYGDPVSGKFDIYYTSDGGTTWTPTLAANVTAPLTGEYGYNGADCTAKIEGGSAAFITNMGRVYKTSDYGITWTVTATAPFSAVGTGKIYIAGANKMIASGTSSVAGSVAVWKQTSDGGATWTAYAPSGNFYSYAMTYVPNSNNMLVSTSPFTTAKGVSYSNDGGTSWTDYADALLQPTAGTNIQCLGVGFSDINHGWVGNYGSGSNTILKFKNNIVFSDIQNNNVANNMLDIYPNPCNGIVYFTLPETNNTKAKLSIIDITGKSIYEQNFHLNSVNRTSFDFTAYAKGIYFVKYASDNHISVKKLIVN